MENLQGPINPCFLGEHFNVEYLEQEFINTEALRFEEVEEEEEGPLFITTPSLEDKMPFLQILQSVETPSSLFSFKEPNFQTLLRLQHLKLPWDMVNPFRPPEMETQIQALDFESCVSQEILDLHSRSPVKLETIDLQNPLSSTSCLEGLSSESNQEQAQVVQISQPNSVIKITHPQQQTRAKSPSTTCREKRKRKRTKPIKNKEVESQRMTHIAVERNRRRQMNDHLNTLRSLMPPSYVQKGDQASIIGGSIDFVKELEQLLQSLEAQKRMKTETSTATVEGCDSTMSTSTTADKAVLCNGYSVSARPEIVGHCEEKMMAKSESDWEAEAEIEVVVIQNHVNLKIQCPRRPGQLLKAIVALEDLRLTFLHLNITSSQTTVHYSFNLKVEEDCKMGSADEIAAAVHQIFSYINAS